MMKPQPSFEMAVTIYQTTQRHNYEDLNLPKRSFENIRSRIENKAKKFSQNLSLRKQFAECQSTFHYSNCCTQL
jgi:hypothetical protein